MKTNLLFRFFTLLLLASITPYLYSQNCSREIAPDVFQIDGASTGIQPGETVCLLSGNKDYLLIQNVHGTASNPVTFVNKGGVVVINTDNYYGIKIAHCSFIRLLGNGVVGTNYGIQVQRVANGAGLAVGDLSTNVEIAYVEIAQTAIGGVYAKTDPTCNDFSSTRDKFTMYNFWFHNCYVHNTEDEGLYIGSSKYTGQHLPDCDTTVFPHLMRGVRIFNNIVENTGWDGIQVSSADENCSIHDNTIRFDSQAEQPGQMSGIILGGGSKCKTFNNQIFDGKGDGIDVLGLGNHEIFNNLIVRAGQTYHPSNPNDFKHGIYVGKVVTETDAILGIYNNTIIEPKSFGVTIVNADLVKTYLLNNLITDPGQLPFVGKEAYINSNVSQDKIVSENNYLKPSTASVGFLNASGDNFDLQPGSKAVNYGQDLIAQGVVFDLLNRSRPFHTLFDAGAFESHDPYASVKTHDNRNLLQWKAYPNPFDSRITVVFIAHKNGTLTAELMDMTGRVVQVVRQKCVSGKQYHFQFNTKKLATNSYLLKLSSVDGVEGVSILQKK